MKLRLPCARDRTEEVLDRGKGGEGMRSYPKIEKGGIMVVKDVPA